MTQVSFNRPSSADTPTILGIWRIGASVHRSDYAHLCLAQPADAAGSPRWDYVIKFAGGGPNESEARRQTAQFVAAATSTVHPNLVPVLDASTTSPTPYLVMPRLEGETMQSQMAAEQRRPLPVALWWIRQVAEALEALHQAGWVHGDVKPTNAIVGRRGHVTLVDLGFASRVHAAPTHLYRGTPDYSAPECLSGEMAAMPAMDVFSLGRMLWQWMTVTQQVHQACLEPVAGLVEGMIANVPGERPTASSVARQLLKLEIETLGQHIGPERRQAA